MNVPVIEDTHTQPKSDSVEDGNHGYSLTQRDDVNEAEATRNSGVEMQQSTTETAEEQSKGAPDTTAPVDLSADSAKAVAEACADADLQSITSPPTSMDVNVALSYTGPTATSFDDDTTSLLQNKKPGDALEGGYKMDIAMSVISQGQLAWISDIL